MGDDPTGAKKSNWRLSAACIIFASILMGFGSILILLGLQLLRLDGSPYYLGSGIAILASGLLLLRGDRRGAWLYGLWLGITLAWSLWEVGLDGWALAPRLLTPIALGCWLLTPWSYDRGADGLAARVARGATITFMAAVLVTVVSIAWPFGTASPYVSSASAAEHGTSAPADWLHYGGDEGGARYAALDQIKPANVDNLKRAWTFRIAAIGGIDYPTLEVTPLQVKDTLYFCNAANDITALDAETGTQRWRFDAHTDVRSVPHPVCRGVAYYQDPAAAKDVPCRERIITATIDARLLAIDSHTGKPCSAFGHDGAVDLRTGMGAIEKGYYYVTSAPQVVRGKVVIGGWVSDNQHMGEPSGVLRGYDALSGRLAWAFDVGKPDDHNEPPIGSRYTPGTPNSWAPISADEALGLVYLPTGNAVPDWYGGQRRSFDDKYNSSVVALDAETGAVRWSFQTVHHDIWDNDVASQPTLYDLPMGVQRMPALIQPTKRGEIFVLDRRTGKPLTQVTERPTPPSEVPGERASPTQPFSTGMPAFAGPRLTEATMWGLTPIDQALCRIAFRQSRYEGPMTPVGIKRPTISYPGYAGGINWGGVSIDKQRDIMIVNSLQMPIRSQLIPRREADRRGIKPIVATGPHDVGGPAAQAGVPYAVDVSPFVSALGIPCQQPPYGMIAGVDMTTRRIIWSHEIGVARNSGPFGINSHLPLPMGTPLSGGSITTRAGLTFIAATQDNYFRAFDTASGQELWKADLPTAGQATPMTYVSSASGRQFVVIAAGGTPGLTANQGAYIIAFALPRRTGH